MRTFISYLAEKHEESIANTDQATHDDAMVDAFDAWLEDMDQDTLISHANKYADLMYSNGQIAAFNKAIDCINGVKI